MELTLEKLKVSFLKNGLDNNNLFHFIYMCHGSEDLIASSNPISQTAQILCFKSLFCIEFYGNQGKNLEKRREVYLHKSIIYNILLPFLHIYYFLVDLPKTFSFCAGTTQCCVEATSVGAVLRRGLLVSHIVFYVYECRAI